MNEIDYAIKRRLAVIGYLAENKEVWVDDFVQGQIENLISYK